MSPVKAKVTDSPFTDGDGVEHARRSYVHVPEEVAEYFGNLAIVEVVEDEPDAPDYVHIKDDGEPCQLCLDAGEPCHLHAEEE